MSNVYWNLPAAWKASSKKWYWNWSCVSGEMQKAERRAEVAERQVKELEAALKQNVAHCKKCCRDNSILNKQLDQEV